MSDRDEPEWKARVEQIDELGKEDPVLAQRLRAARSREFLADHSAKERSEELDFARSMMQREKEDLLRINARVRQVNQWCRFLGETDRKYHLVKFPSDLLSPYGQFMARNDATVALKAHQLKLQLATPSGPAEPREPLTRTEVRDAASTARSAVRSEAGVASPARSSHRAGSGSSSASLPPVAASSRLTPPRSSPGSTRRPGSAASALRGTSPLSARSSASRPPSSSAAAAAAVPSVTGSRVVIRLSRAGEEPRQLSVALFEREYAKLKRRVDAAKKAKARPEPAPSPAGTRGVQTADRLLVDEAAAVVDNRASPAGLVKVRAAARRQSRAQVQAELRRALRETAFLAEALRTQARILRERGWNQGGRGGAPAAAPDGVPALGRARARGDL